ncbi:hypothetical protein AVEN_9755-1 [Araneus ventricosus]|uniref:Uncharacterized protein n=1 Tax=Araneus ventricosus TaxID=182803 RepID=A0A4Y2PZF8_ARAVE|nr:hypothetical protein AVEN_9755-1 [Araneus ventricosus]
MGGLKNHLRRDKCYLLQSLQKLCTSTTMTERDGRRRRTDFREQQHLSSQMGFREFSSNLKEIVENSWFKSRLMHTDMSLKLVLLLSVTLFQLQTVTA